MTKNLLDLSGKIDVFRVEIFQTVASVAESLGIRFFVVGATARDMILQDGYGIRTIRATQDIDLGVRVPTWADYEALLEALKSDRKVLTNQREIQA